jgi:hypothetical protein
MKTILNILSGIGMIILVSVFLVIVSIKFVPLAIKEILKT